MSTFFPGDRVLAYHGVHIYESKVLEVRTKTVEGQSRRFYKIHYHGWKSRWDEWVDEARVLAPTAENLALQQELNDAFSGSMRRTDGAVDADVAEDSAAAGFSSSATTSLIEEALAAYREQLEFPPNYETFTPLELRLPSELLLRFSRDCHFVMANQLPTMPRTPSVLQVLTAFTIACPPDASMLCPDPAFYPLSHSVDVGLVQLFDSALGSRLLYRTERPRYRTLLLAHPDSRPSQLFGAEHLLRLLVLLPELLAESVQVLGNVRFEPIQARLSALVRFMVDFSETIFAH